MKTFSANQKQKDEVVLLYKKTKNRSSNLNRARPNSIASGLIYFWIQTSGINITLKEFATKTNLSEITILKISKEIASVIDAIKLKK